MFMEANEPLFEIAADHNYVPKKVEVAIDITDWPYYGDSDSDDYVRGTKPGRNYARAWKYITLSLVGTDTPFILLVLSVRRRSDAPKYVRRLLRHRNRFSCPQRGVPLEVGVAGFGGTDILLQLHRTSLQHLNSGEHSSSR